MAHLVDAHHIGGHQTGNETWIRNVLRELVTLAEPGEIDVAASAGGAKEVKALVGRAPHVVGDSALRRLMADLPSIARRTSADSVLVQYTLPLSRRPAVVMVHDLSVFDDEAAQWVPWRFRARVRLSIADSVRRAAFLLTPSEFTRRQLVQDLGVDPARVAISVNAVDPSLRALIDDAVAPPADRPVVLAVGNVLPRKNLGVLGNAVAELRRQGLPASLRVVGSVPPASSAIVAELQNRLGDALHVTGYVTQQQLAAEYRAASVLAFPSLFEGFGIPVIEAMYAGLPVVVSDRAALPEIAGSHGRVVAADDDAAWATALGEALSDRDTGRDARRTWSTSYSWQVSAKAVLDALRLVASGARRVTA